MISFFAERKKASYDFMANRARPGSFENNWKNNSIDALMVMDGGGLLRSFRCQTVANYCFGDHAGPSGLPYGDTIAAGEFTVKAFVDPRKFHGEIHAITRTRDLEGEWIDHNAMQVNAKGYQLGRWLIHDRYSFELKRDTNYAWSAGCFILSSGDLAALNVCLKAKGIRPGNLLAGRLEEV